MSLLDQRTEQRFSTRLACQIEAQDGERCSALITKISESGLHLAGDSRMMQLVFPQLTRANWRDPIDVLIRFSVCTTDNVNVPVVIQCKCIYTRRIYHNWFAVGCKFSEIDAVSQTRLSNYIIHFIAQHSSALADIRARGRQIK